MIGCYGTTILSKSEKHEQVQLRHKFIKKKQFFDQISIKFAITLQTLSVTREQSFMPTDFFSAGGRNLYFHSLTLPLTVFFLGGGFLVKTALEYFGTRLAQK